MFELILASASPRRQSLLKALGLSLKVQPQDIDESLRPHEEPQALVRRLAVSKARSALQASLNDNENNNNVLVLGSDTIVVCEGVILGKPLDKKEAVDTLKSLSGRKHQVMTAVALMNNDHEEIAVSITEVRFKHLSDEEIDAYWESGEPQDKAGSYAIQGLGGMFVSEINGSYSGVVGLPIFETSQLLGKFGVTTEAILQNA